MAAKAPRRLIAPAKMRNFIAGQVLVELEADRIRQEQGVVYQSDIVRWGEEHFYLGKTSKPIILAPHQKVILRWAYTRRANGRLPFRIVLYSSIKKSGKSTIGGVVGRWIAETQARYAEVFCVGNDLDQAKGRAFHEIEVSLEATPGYDKLHKRLPGRWDANKALTHTCFTTGTQVKAIAVDAKGEAGGKQMLTIWCVTGDHEVLCRSGWKRADELTTDDEVADLNPATGIMYWHRPRAVNITPYSGKMMRFKHRRAEFVVTPNHRVLGQFIWDSSEVKKEHERGWHFEEAQKAARYMGGWLKGDADWEGETSFDPLKAKFLGYYLAEGSTSGRSVYLAQSQIKNPEIYEDMVDLLQEMGYEPERQEGAVRVRDSALALECRQYGKSADKFVPQELKNAQPEALRSFFDAFIAGDGSWGTWGSRPDSCSATTISPRLADDLAEVGLKLGYHPRVSTYESDRRWNEEHPNKGGRITGPVYRLSFSKGPIYWTKAGGHWTEEDYEGTVACPSLPFGVFYVRYNGKCCWTGNTELWGFEYEDALRFWDEMTPIPTEPDSQRLVETYAGYEGESELLYGLYQTGLAGRQLTNGEVAAFAARDVPGETYEELLYAFAETNGDPSAKVPMWVDEPAQLFMYWDEGLQARRMPWQQGEEGDAYYRSEEADLPPKAFRRLHFNEWTSAESQFVPIASWDGCYDTLVGRLVPGEKTPLIIGVDAASTSDCFGIVVVSRYDQKHATDVSLRACKKWDPKEEGGVVDYAEPENFLRLICQGGCLKGHAKSMPRDDCEYCQRSEFAIPKHNVLQICYDPYQLEDMMQRLRKDGVAWCEPFQQNQDRLKGDRQLYDLIINRRLHHSEDPDGPNTPMRQHISNANAKVQKDQDSTMRIVKKAEKRKIDLAVALAMASARCLYLTY